MGTFRDYVDYREEVYEDDGPKIDSENTRSLNSAVEKAVDKGYKQKIIDFIRGFGDEEINRELDDAEKGLGDITQRDRQKKPGESDVVVPANVDNESPGLDD